MGCLECGSPTRRRICRTCELADRAEERARAPVECFRCGSLIPTDADGCPECEG